jgi:short-subunit dehydrogenase
MDTSDSYAIITGATGGIGSSFAHHLASKKYNLLLTDLDSKRLHEMAQKLEDAYKVSVKTESVNLTDGSELSAFVNKIKKLKDVGILVNCAGFGGGERFCNEKVERQLKMIQVHISATVQLVHAVLPGMIKRRKGDIITVSSLSAFIPAPGSSIYAATKSFLNSFMESIHMEVQQFGVRVQSLCPGLTRTEFHSRLKEEGKRSSLNKAIPFMEADEVVTHSLKCLKKGKVICIPGCFNKVIKKGIPVLPRKSFYSISKKVAEKNL